MAVVVLMVSVRTSHCRPVEHRDHTTGTFAAVGVVIVAVAVVVIVVLYVVIEDGIQIVGGRKVLL